MNQLGQLPHSCSFSLPPLYEKFPKFHNDISATGKASFWSLLRTEINDLD